MVTLSLEHGNSAISAYAYAGYGISLTAKMKDYEQGYQFGQLALNLLPKYPDKYIAQRSYFVFAYFMNHWKSDFNKNIEFFHHSLNLALETGDLTEAGYAISNILFTKIFSSYTLNEILEESDQHLELIKKANDPTVTNIFSCSRQFILNMKGQTENSLCLSNCDYDEESNLELLKSIKNYQLVGLVLIIKLIIAFIRKENQVALELSAAVERYLPAISGLFYSAQYIFFYAITLTLEYDSMPAKEKSESLTKINELYKQIQNWNQICHDNFKFMDLLLTAELNRIHNNLLPAMDYYEQALDECQSKNYFLYQIVALRCSKYFYKSIKKSRLSQYFEVENNLLLSQWQADSLVELSNNTGVFETTKISTDTSTHTTNQIDLNSIVKNSQALSSEIVLSELLKKVMKILIENAGAQKGIFVILENGNAYIKAIRNIEEEDLYFSDNVTIEEYLEIPKAVIRFVLNSKNNLIIKHACKNEQFMEDSYILNNQVKSVLCVPLLLQGQLLGIIYLENNLAENIFTEKQLQIINLLSSQIAISIHNSLLYNNMEKLVKERTKELSKSEERYRTLIEMSPDGILIHDQDKIYYINQAAKKMFSNFEIDDLQNKSIYDLLSEASSSKMKNRITKLYENEEFIPFTELKVKSLEGDELDVETASVSFQDENNLKILTFLRDITRRKQIEMIRENTERLVRHDLKNPLNGIIGISQLLLKDRSLTKKSLKWANMIYSSGKKMNDIIDNSLDLFKMEQGVYQFQPIEFNLIECLKRIDHNFITFKQGKSLEIDYQLFGSPMDWDSYYIIEGEEIHLENVFLNLIKNALEASPEENKITVSVDINDKYHQISIHNMGVIPRRIRDTFFDPYITSGKVGGTGLGTYSAKLIVSTHKGEIYFETSEETGTTVFVNLPKVYDQNIKNLVNPIQHKVIKRILLVDDDEIVHDSVKELLEPEGYEVESVNGGLEAIKKILTNKYDLILMDLIMPKLDGIQTTDKIRNEIGLTEIPIIALTSDTNQDIKEKCFEAGLNYYMKKPFQLKEFEDFISKLKGENN